MKDITISIDDDVYRAASEEAARQRKSLGELVQELLTRLRTERQQNGSSTQAEPELPAVADREALAEQLNRLAEAARERDRDKKGPLFVGTRKDWYAGFGYVPEPQPTAEEIEREERERREELAQFFAELNAQPREDGPSVGPLNREELYQRGIR